jgi:hypothetical protein
MLLLFGLLFFAVRYAVLESHTQLEKEIMLVHVYHAIDNSLKEHTSC